MKTGSKAPIIVIPARMAATRLPGKPLADIGGRPMIRRVMDQALKSDCGPVLVAAGDQEIVDAVIASGGQAVLTDPNLPSGTDRILAALEIFDPEGAYDPIINLQGDMPTIDPALIKTALNALVDGADMATLVSPLNDGDEEADQRDDENVVKAIIVGNGDKTPARCLYFTRTIAPWGAGPIFRHLGIYVYTRAALTGFVRAGASALEKREKLEQLRALEMGLSLYAGLVADFPKGVDAPEHLEVARAYYQQREG